MKQIKEEVVRQVKDTVIQYQATDGTLFSDSEECLKYENSAKGVLRGRVARLFVGERVNEWDCIGGCDDHDIVGVSIPEESDIATILQFYYLENPYLLEDRQKERREVLADTFRKAYEEGDVLLFGVNNCDDEYYFINTRDTIIKNLKKFEKQTEKV